MRPFWFSVITIYIVLAIGGCLLMFSGTTRRVGAAEQVHVDVQPLDLFAGQDGDAICFVPRAIINESVEVGFLSGPMSEVQLKGIRKEIFLQHYEAMPCGPITAYCDLRTTKGAIKVLKTVTVGRCD